MSVFDIRAFPFQQEVGPTRIHAARPIASGQKEILPRVGILCDSPTGVNPVVTKALRVKYLQVRQCESSAGTKVNYPALYAFAPHFGASCDPRAWEKRAPRRTPLTVEISFAPSGAMVAGA
jgi:hypothetical protein